MAKRSREPGIDDDPNAKRVAPNTSATLSSDSNKKASAQKGKSRNGLSSRRRKSTPQNNEKPVDEKGSNAGKIIVGVDYGTTYSGVSFVSKTGAEARDVNIIATWPGRTAINEQYEKVPSRIAYAAENNTLNGKDAWGLQVTGDLTSYAWTKLLLDRDAQHSQFDGTHLDERLREGLLELPPGSDAEHVAADFLRNLYGHTFEQLERYYGKSVMAVKPIEFWFTYPATWGDRAVNATRNAAQTAGFASRQGDELCMITEPEAAAIAALSSAIEMRSELYKENTNVLIADLGGGTLDFQCLTINKLMPLKLEETVPGIGGKSGGTYVDCEFFKWLSKTFGQTFDTISTTKTSPGSSFFAAWEMKKRHFDGDLSVTHRLHFPALGVALRKANATSMSYDFDDHQVVISSQDMALMFDPMIEKALELVEEQLKALKKARKGQIHVLVLCGGMGSNQYVWSRFNQFCNANYPHLELVTDPKAWSTVVRGAAIRGLAAHRKFEEGVDLEQDAFICPLYGKRAARHVGWVVKRGMNFHPKFRAELPVYVAISATDDNDDLAFIWDLYICTEDEAPLRIRESVVRWNATISLDLSQTFKWSKNAAMDGTHDKADVKIVMKLGDESGILVVEALHKRRVVGTAKIDYGVDHIRQPTQRLAGLLN